MHHILVADTRIFTEEMDAFTGNSQEWWPLTLRSRVYKSHFRVNAVCSSLPVALSGVPHRLPGLLPVGQEPREPAENRDSYASH